MTREERAKDYAEHNIDKYTNDFANLYNAYLTGATEETKELEKMLEDMTANRDYWKDSSFDWRHKCTSKKPFKVAVKAQRQLTKAKDLLAKWVELYNPKLEGFPKPPIQVDTEQFLKESE